MSYQNILLEKQAGMGIIKINRPNVRNALNRQTLEEMQHAFRTLESDEAIGVIVFTGAGDKAFAAGADINQLAKYQPFDALSSLIASFYREIENAQKVTIAAVNGYALGGGCELAMACDIRIASDNAKFGLPELNLAVIPGAGGTQRLTRLIGKSRAMNLILTGEFLSADEAKENGLVCRVVPLGELWSAVEEKANKIISKGPLAVRLAKIAINNGADADLNTGLMIEKLAQAVLYSTADKAEGTAAFLEKRLAAFAGK